MSTSTKKRSRSRSKSNDRSESKKDKVVKKEHNYALVPKFKKRWSVNELLFNRTHKDLIELKEWISELDDKIIFENNLIATKYTGIDYDIDNNYDVISMSSCGLTSQGILNLLLDKNPEKSKITIIKETEWNKNLLSNHNIIHVDMKPCSCCYFPGHAFVIYCSGNIGVILQSFIGCYTIRDFFDIMPMKKIDKYMNVFADMHLNGTDEYVIKQLSKFTHVGFDRIKGCKMKSSRFNILFYQSDHAFKK